jgi:hypothetical protein
MYLITLKTVMFLFFLIVNIEYMLSSKISGHSFHSHWRDLNLQEFSLNKVSCTGEESKLNECPHESGTVCQSGSHAGVVCRADDEPVVAESESKPGAISAYDLELQRRRCKNLQRN